MLKMYADFRPDVIEGRMAFYERKYGEQLHRAGELGEENRKLKNALDDISEILEEVLA